MLDRETTYFRLQVGIHFAFHRGIDVSTTTAHGFGRPDLPIGGKGDLVRGDCNVGACGNGFRVDVGDDWSLETLERFDYFLHDLERHSQFATGRMHVEDNGSRLRFNGVFQPSSQDVENGSANLVTNRDDVGFGLLPTYFRFLARVGFGRKLIQAGIAFSDDHTRTGVCLVINAGIFICKHRKRKSK